MLPATVLPRKPCCLTSAGELRLTVDLPTSLAEDKDLKLIIKGKVIFLEAPKNQNGRHRVSLKFENKYIIDESK